MVRKNKGFNSCFVLLPHQQTKAKSWHNPLNSLQVIRICYTASENVKTYNLRIIFHSNLNNILSVFVKKSHDQQIVLCISEKKMSFLHCYIKLWCNENIPYYLTSFWCVIVFAKIEYDSSFNPFIRSLLFKKKMNRITYYTSETNLLSLIRRRQIFDCGFSRIKTIYSAM